MTCLLISYAKREFLSLDILFICKFFSFLVFLMEWHFAERNRL